jgi:Domain of unknown function (DUF5658)
MTVTLLLTMALIVLNLGDIWTTRRCMPLAGFYEANPLARWSFRTLGFWPSVLPKLLVTSVSAWVVWDNSPLSPRAFGVLLTVVLLYGWVVWNNLRTYRKARAHAMRSPTRRAGLV